MLKISRVVSRVVSIVIASMVISLSGCVDNYKPETTILDTSRTVWEGADGGIVYSTTVKLQYNGIEPVYRRETRYEEFYYRGLWEYTEVVVGELELLHPLLNSPTIYKVQIDIHTRQYAEPRGRTEVEILTYSGKVLFSVIEG